MKQKKFKPLIIKSHYADYYGENDIWLEIIDEAYWVEEADYAVAEMQLEIDTLTHLDDKNINSIYYYKKYLKNLKTMTEEFLCDNIAEECRFLVNLTNLTNKNEKTYVYIK